MESERNENKNHNEDVNVDNEASDKDIRNRDGHEDGNEYEYQDMPNGDKMSKESDSSDTEEGDDPLNAGSHQPSGNQPGKQVVNTPGAPPTDWDVYVRILPSVRITHCSKCQTEPTFRQIAKVLNTKTDKSDKEWVKILCKGDKSIYAYWVEKDSLTGSQVGDMIEHFSAVKERREGGIITGMVQCLQTLFM